MCSISKLIKITHPRKSKLENLRLVLTSFQCQIPPQALMMTKKELTKRKLDKGVLKFFIYMSWKGPETDVRLLGGFEISCFLAISLLV